MRLMPSRVYGNLSLWKSPRHPVVGCRRWRLESEHDLLQFSVYTEGAVLREKRAVVCDGNRKFARPRSQMRRKCKREPAMRAGGVSFFTVVATVKKAASIKRQVYKAAIHASASSCFGVSHSARVASREKRRQKRREGEREGGERGRET